MHWAVRLCVRLPSSPSLPLAVRLSIKRIDDALNQGPFGCNNGHLAANLINFVLARYVFPVPAPFPLPIVPRASTAIECSKCSARRAPVCGQLQPQSALQYKGIRVENMQEKNSPHMVCNTHTTCLPFLLWPLFHSQLQQKGI